LRGTSAAALLLKTCPIIVPIALFVAAPIASCLIFEPLGITWIENCIQSANGGVHILSQSWWRQAGGYDARRAENAR
jgi:hypothetical protein